MYTKEQFLKYPRKHMRKDVLWRAQHARGQKNLKRTRIYTAKLCPLCKRRMKYNWTFSEWYCMRCGKFLPDIQEEIWGCFR